MIKKEIAEIKRQFTPANCSISRICGCYVDGEKNKKAEFKEAKSSKEIQTTIKKFCAEFPEDMVSLFIAKAGGLNV